MTSPVLQQFCNELEEIVQVDHGNRGIAHLIQALDGCSLARAAKLLSVNRKTVGILTGFPCNVDYSPPTETDGPAGALAIAKALHAIGSQVVVLTDQVNKAVLATFQDFLPIEVIGVSQFDRKTFEFWADKLDHIVAIERPGQAKDQKYYTMRGIDLSSKVAPFEKLIQMMKARDKERSFTAIGDGGNELGMGNILSTVERYIPHGETIGCCIPSDHLIVGAVSNWAGFALAAAICAADLLNKGSPSFNGLLTSAEHFQLAENLRVLGVRDGVTGEADAKTVDGLPFSLSEDILRQIHEKLEYIIKG